MRVDGTDFSEGKFWRWRAKRRKLSSATSWPLLPTAWKEIVDDSQTFGLTELKLWPSKAAKEKEAIFPRKAGPPSFEAAKRLERRSQRSNASHCQINLKEQEVFAATLLYLCFY
jgi:hypothetical protein